MFGCHCYLYTEYFWQGWGTPLKFSTLAVIESGEFGHKRGRNVGGLYKDNYKTNSPCYRRSNSSSITMTSKPRGIPHDCSSGKITLARSQRAPLWLQGYRPNTPLSNPVCVIVQPRQGSLAIPSRSTPEHFGGSSGTGPHDRIDVVRRRLFSPEELLTAEDEMALGFADVGVRIE